MQTFEEMKQYLGKRCLVILHHTDPDPEARVTGIVKYLDDEGSVHVLTDKGMRYCWPCLEIREVKEEL